MTWFQKIQTSKNLTVFGILIILEVLVSAAKSMFDGDSNTNIDFKALFEGVSVGIVAIMAKGQSNTGGVLPATPEAVARVPSVP